MSSESGVCRLFATSSSEDTAGPEDDDGALSSEVVEEGERALVTSSVERDIRRLAVSLPGS